jgi:hypothetical protein
MLEYANGATGYLYCSTVDSPGTDIIELSGERGKLQVIGKTLRYWELPQGVKAFSDTSPEMWQRPPAIEIDVPIEECESGHIAILRNMARHLLHGEPLIAPGVEGIRTIEMINSVILSGHTGEAVSIPVDRRRYDAFLAERRAQSTFQKHAGGDRRETDNVHH